MGRAMGSMTIFRNCTVLDGAVNEPRPGCDVLIEGNRIREREIPSSLIPRSNGGSRKDAERFSLDLVVDIDVSDDVVEGTRRKTNGKKFLDIGSAHRVGAATYDIAERARETVDAPIYIELLP